MTHARDDQFDKLKEAVHVAGVSSNTHVVPDRQPAGETGDAKSPVFLPAPIDVLPKVIRDFVTQTAKSIGCAPEMVLAPVLGVLAGAIGNRRRIVLKPDWSEPCVLWLMTVAPPSSMKSPALEKATAPLDEIQRMLFAEWRHDIEVWQANGSEGPKPKPERVLIGDITIEALADRLADNPMGLTLVADEGSTWLGGFNRYKNQGGTDAAQWCSIWAAKSISVDRKSGDRPVIYVPCPCVSIVGTTQPGTLARCLTGASYESGLAARLILVNPPSRRKRWSKGRSVEPGVIESMHRIVESLLAMQPDIDENGQPTAKLIELNDGADAEWGRWYDANAQRQHECTDERLQGLLGKAEAHVTRLALLLHCVHVASGVLGQDNPVDAVSMAAAIELGDWLAQETWRVWQNLAESEDIKERRELAKWVAHRGGASVRELSSSGPRAFRGDRQAAESAMDVLSRHGFHWEQPLQLGPGGPKARRLVKDSSVDAVDADTGTPAGKPKTAIVESASSGDAAKNNRDNEAGSEAEAP